MNGDFSFSAQADDETTYDQTAITFSSLPAVRMTLSVTDQ